MPDTISFIEKGKGKPIILLHGFCESGEIWNRNIEELAKQYRVLAPDLPGFGRSPLAKEQITIESIAARLSHWINEIIRKPVVMFGHSLGGYITLAFAENHADQLLGYGLIHSTAYADTEEKKENRLKAAEFVLKNGTAAFVKTLIPSLFYKNNSPEKKELVEEVMNIALETPASTISAYSLAMRERPPREKILSGELPVLFIAGKNDKVVPLKVSERQIRVISKGESVILQNSGHMGMMEESEVTNTAIINFINNYIYAP